METIQEPNMDAVEKEVMKDFDGLVKKIDFSSYSPYDKTYMTALFVGEMWNLIHKLNKHMVREVHSDVPSKYADIAEEIEGAKKYMKLGDANGDMQYKSMAGDELRHAEILIKKAMAKNPVPTEQKVLHELEETHNSLKAKL